MKKERQWLTRAVVVLGAVALLWSATPVVAGMAELGKPKKLTLLEAGSDPAVGGGVVTLNVEGHAFVHETVAAETVSDVLEDLESQVKSSGLGLDAFHTDGSDQITVELWGGGELNTLSLTVANEEGFGRVYTTLSGELIQVSVRAVVATNNDGEIDIEVNGHAGRSATVDTSLFATPGDINNALVAALIAQGFAASLQSGTGTELIVITGDTMLSEGVRSVAWEDTDSGILAIGSNSLGAGNIPTLTGWGMILMAVLLVSASLFVMRRRMRPAES